MNCKECKKEYIGKEQEKAICCSCSEKKKNIKEKAIDFILVLLFLALALLAATMNLRGI